MEITKNDIEQAVGLLKILISTPSVSRDESEAADKLQSYMERSIPFPGTVHRHLNNIWCIAPGYDAQFTVFDSDLNICKEFSNCCCNETRCIACNF